MGSICNPDDKTNTSPLQESKGNHQGVSWKDMKSWGRVSFLAVYWDVSIHPNSVIVQTIPLFVFSFSRERLIQWFTFHCLEDGIFNYRLQVNTSPDITVWHNTVPLRQTCPYGFKSNMCLCNLLKTHADVPKELSVPPHLHAGNVSPSYSSITSYLLF